MVLVEEYPKFVGEQKGKKFNTVCVHWPWKPPKIIREKVYFYPSSLIPNHKMWDGGGDGAA